MTDTTTFFPDSDSAIHPPPSSSSTSADPQTETHTSTNADATVLVTLTHSPLSTAAATAHTRTPTSGATVLFLGTTRSYFRDPTRPVSRLEYSAYTALALRTLTALAETALATFGLERVYVAHRLGVVGVGEESIVVAVSSPHRGPAFEGAAEVLEKVKEKAEIWKREWFVDGAVVVGRDGEQGQKEEEIGVWRDNRESDRMGKTTTVPTKGTEEM